MKILTLLSHLQAEVIINYHIGETILSLQKTTLIPGGSESLVYTTLSGGIGILVPFTSHEVWFLKAQPALMCQWSFASVKPLKQKRSLLASLLTNQIGTVT